MYGQVLTFPWWRKSLLSSIRYILSTTLTKKKRINILLHKSKVMTMVQPFACKKYSRSGVKGFTHLHVLGCLLGIYSPLLGQTEKAMATHSSTLAWKIPWTEEPGRLQSMGSLRVGYHWATSLSLFTFMHWRRKWQPTPVFLPGESQGRRSLMGCHLWGRTESDMTEAT